MQIVLLINKMTMNEIYFFNNHACKMAMLYNKEYKNYIKKLPINIINKCRRNI